MLKKIGLRIRRVRMDQGIKQKDLAKKVGISQGALTNFELGRRKISLEWLIKIAKALESPVGYFLIDIEPPIDSDALGPRDMRLIRAFHKLAADAKLQGDFLHAIERVGKLLDKVASKGSRSR